MSSEVVSFLPADSQFKVAADLLPEIEAYLANRYKNAREIQLNRAHEKPFFIDAGENHESIRCPLCDHEISDSDWQDTMNECWDEASQGFDLRPFLFKYCGGSTTPDRLIYVPHQGFAKTSFEISDPSETEHDEVEQLLADLLKTEIKTVVARY